MRDAIFVDSGAYIAFCAANDQHHEEAVAQFAAIEKEKRSMLTSTDIVDEAVTLVKKWAGQEAATELGERLQSDVSTRIFQIDAAVRRDAWKLFKTYDDKSFSLTDCTAMVVMKRYGVTEIFSFDREFEKVGLKRVP